MDQHHFFCLETVLIGRIGSSC